jgi:hypothetical protein
MYIFMIRVHNHAWSSLTDKPDLHFIVSSLFTTSYHNLANYLSEPHAKGRYAAHVGEGH